MDDFPEMLLFHSLIKKKKIVTNPSSHPTPSLVGQQPWEACRCPDLPPLAPLLYLLILPRFQAEETKHVWWENN